MRRSGSPLGGALRIIPFVGTDLLNVPKLGLKNLISLYRHKSQPQNDDDE